MSLIAQHVVNAVDLVEVLNYWSAPGTMLAWLKLSEMFVEEDQRWLSIGLSPSKALSALGRMALFATPRCASHAQIGPDLANNQHGKLFARQ